MFRERHELVVLAATVLLIALLILGLTALGRYQPDQTTTPIGVQAVPGT